VTSQLTQEQRQQKIHALHESTKKDMDAVLTPDQQAEDGANA